MTDERSNSPGRDPQEPIVPDLEGLDPRRQAMEQMAADLRVEDTSEDVHAEFDKKLESFDRRFHAERTAHEARKIEEAERLRSQRESTKGLGLGMTLAYAIVGVPVFGYFVGFFVDKANQTTTYAGIGMLIGALIGIAVAMMMLGKQAK